MSQRFVPLEVHGRRVRPHRPASGERGAGPAASHMVFIVDHRDGVPSKSSFITVSSGPTAPAAPGRVEAAAANASAAATRTVPSDGGSPITSYTVTPYLGTTRAPKTDLLAEDRVSSRGATPNARAIGGANTASLMATIALKPR